MSPATVEYLMAPPEQELLLADVHVPTYVASVSSAFVPLAIGVVALAVLDAADMFPAASLALTL